MLVQPDLTEREAWKPSPEITSQLLIVLLPPPPSFLVLLSQTIAEAKSCKILTPPKNGYIQEGTGVASVGQERHFLCNSGFSLYGPNILSCQGDLEWSSDPPLCLGK